MGMVEKVLVRYQRRLASISVGKTIENGLIRIHRYAHTIMVWDLTFAGKRGKKVERLAIETSSIGGPLGQGLLDEIVGKLEDCTTLDQVKKVLLSYTNDIHIGSYFERSIDVYPAGFKEVSIRTPHVLVEVGYKDFTVKNLDDIYNEETCIPAIKGGLRSIPVFYRWVRDNESEIKNMTFYQIVDIMSKLGVPTHSYCAVD